MGSRRVVAPPGVGTGAPQTRPARPAGERAWMGTMRPDGADRRRFGAAVELAAQVAAAQAGDPTSAPVHKRRAIPLHRAARGGH